MNVTIGNSFSENSGTQVYYQRTGAGQETLNPGAETPTPAAIGRNETVTIHTDGSCSLRFQMGRSDNFILQVQKSGNNWILRNTTGNTEVQVKIGADGQ